MNTITVWLLVSIGSGYMGSGALPTWVVERFATQSECQRVQDWMTQPASSFKPRLGCIQATIVKP